MLQVLGSLVSILIIWVVTGVLLYEAVLRVITPQEVDGRLMFILAAAGIVVNLSVMAIFGHGHSHAGHDHGHHHGPAKGVSQGSGGRAGLVVLGHVAARPLPVAGSATEPEGISPLSSVTACTAG